VRAFGDRGADDWADEDWVGVGFKYYSSYSDKSPRGDEPRGFCFVYYLLVEEIQLAR
jgi:hypothetical protein